MKKGRIEIGLAVFVFLIALWDTRTSGIVAIVVLACLAFYRYHNDTPADAVGSAPVAEGNPAQVEAKRKHFDEILAYARGKESVTNNDIEKLLGVSDATAERYLNELEQKGKLKQVGKTGKSVSYILKK
ncbi:MAG: FaeA/PapI family transcriptional regulator [Candidatus Paceibacterota bacterium]